MLIVDNKNNAMYGVFRSHVLAYIRDRSRISGKWVHMYKGVRCSYTQSMDVHDDPDIQTSSSAGYVSMAVNLRPLRICDKY